MRIAGTVLKCSALLTVLALLGWIGAATLDHESSKHEFAAATAAAALRSPDTSMLHGKKEIPGERASRFTRPAEVYRARATNP